MRYIILHNIINENKIILCGFIFDCDNKIGKEGDDDNETIFVNIFTNAVKSRFLFYAHTKHNIIYIYIVLYAHDE